VVVPPGEVQEAARFYGEVVGLEPIERPESMGGVGAWFRAGSQELHISEHEGFVAAVKAHPAFEVSAPDSLLSPRGWKPPAPRCAGTTGCQGPVGSTRSTPRATGSSF